MRELCCLVALIILVTHLDDFDRILRNSGRCTAAAPAVPLVTQ